MINFCIFLWHFWLNVAKDQWTVGPIDCTWLFEVCRCWHSSCCYSVDILDQWTVGPMDLMAIWSLSLLPFILLLFSGLTNGLSDQWSVGSRTNGLLDQWTVWLFEVCHCCNSSCCYSVDCRINDCRTNGLPDQWGVGPMDCMALQSLSLLPFILLLFSRSAGPMDCRTNELYDLGSLSLLPFILLLFSGLAEQWTVGPIDRRTNGLSDQWTVWLFEVSHCCHSSCCYSVDPPDQWTVGSMDCRTNELYDLGSLSLLPFILLLFSGLAEQWTVGPIDRRTNGLSDQWTVWLFEVSHCCHSSCCYSVDLSDQWTVGPASWPRSGYTLKEQQHGQK